MDLKEIVEFLKKNEASDEMVKFLEGLKTVNLDSVKDFLENDEAGKKFLQSQKDAAVTKGIATFKEKTLPGLIEEEIKKQFPEETEEQKRMRELENKQKKLEEELKRKELLARAQQIAIEKQLPLEIVDRFLGDDEESTVQNLDLLAGVYSKAVEKAVEEKFKEFGRETPPGGPGPGKNYDEMSDEEFFKTREAIYNKN